MIKRKPPFAECTEIPERQREGRIIADTTVHCYSDRRLHIRKCGDILFLFPFFLFVAKVDHLRYSPDSFQDSTDLFKTRKHLGFYLYISVVT